MEKPSIHRVHSQPGRETDRQTDMPPRFGRADAQTGQGVPRPSGVNVRMSEVSVRLVIWTG